MPGPHAVGWEKRLLAAQTPAEDVQDRWSTNDHRGYQRLCQGAPIRTRTVVDEYQRQRGSEQSNGGARPDHGTAGSYRERMVSEDSTRRCEFGNRGADDARSRRAARLQGNERSGATPESRDTMVTGRGHLAAAR
jgi:hypothetical protein